MISVRVRLAIVLVVGLSPGLLVAQDRPPIAVLRKVSGPVHLLLVSTGTPISLVKKDEGRKLFAGQTIYCDPGGRATVLVLGKTLELDKKKKSLLISAPGRRLTPEESEAQDALEYYAVPAGGRATPGILYSPAAGGAVWIDRLRVRWVHDLRGGTWTFLLTEGTETLWTTTDVNVSAGELAANTTATLRGVLDRRRTVKADGYALTLAQDETPRETATFTVLDGKAEQELATALARWDKQPDLLMRAIGRAFAFHTRRLFSEAADEYETAMSRVGESEDLLSAAIAAHHRTGNLRRADELRAILARAKSRH